MYKEHPNGGIKEVDSRNVDFLEDEFPSIVEVNMTCNCMSYNKTYLSVRERICILTVSLRVIVFSQPIEIVGVHPPSLLKVACLLRILNQ